jgi:hypothetical protein
MPPSIASVRSAIVFWIRGSSTLPSTANTMRKAMVPMISSGHSGISGLVGGFTTTAPTWYVTVWPPVG